MHARIAGSSGQRGLIEEPDFCLHLLICINKENTLETYWKRTTKHHRFMEFHCSKATLLASLTATLLLSWMLLGHSSLLLRPLSVLGVTLTSRMTSTVSPYSMVFVTAPNKDVAESLAGGMGKKAT